jgi:hypothetical protein
MEQALATPWVAPIDKLSLPITTMRDRARDRRSSPNRGGALAGHRADSGIDSCDDRDRSPTEHSTKPAFGRLSGAFALNLNGRSPNSSATERFKIKPMARTEVCHWGSSLRQWQGAG